MKNKIKFFVSAFLVVCSATYSFGQANATATSLATTTVITPLSITKTVDLNFGNIAVSATAGGTVTMSAGGVRSTTGNVSLPAAAGSPAVATFTVNGLGTSTYAITLPTSVDLAYLTNHMTASTFTSTPSATGALTGGTQTLTVGATLAVGMAQVPGTYVSATAFPVIVCYN